MSKPRKLERFKKSYIEHVIAWEAMPWGTKVTNQGRLQYKGRHIQTKYREIFLDRVPQISIILN